MAVAKDYEIARVEIDPATANVGLLFSLVIVDSGYISFSKNHRFSIPAAMTIPDAETFINGVLAGEDYPVLAAADVAALTAVFTAARANLGKPKLPVGPPVP